MAVRHRRGCGMPQVWCEHRDCFSFGSASVVEAFWLVVRKIPADDGDYLQSMRECKHFVEVMTTVSFLTWTVVGLIMTIVDF